MIFANQLAKVGAIHIVLQGSSNYLRVNLGKGIPGSLKGQIDDGIIMGNRIKGGFELTARQINAPIHHGPEKLGEHFGIR